MILGIGGGGGGGGRVGVGVVEESKQLLHFCSNTTRIHRLHV